MLCHFTSRLRTQERKRNKLICRKQHTPINHRCSLCVGTWDWQLGLLPPTAIICVSEGPLSSPHCTATIQQALISCWPSHPQNLPQKTKTHFSFGNQTGVMSCQTRHPVGSVIAASENDDDCYSSHEFIHERYCHVPLRCRSSAAVCDIYNHPFVVGACSFLRDVQYAVEHLQLEDCCFYLGQLSSIWSCQLSAD